MKVGFIGLGIMGKPMSKNLLKAGNELVVFDFNEAAVAEVVEATCVSPFMSFTVTPEAGVVLLNS